MVELRDRVSAFKRATCWRLPVDLKEPLMAVAMMIRDGVEWTGRADQMARQICPTAKSGARIAKAYTAKRQMVREALPRLIEVGALSLVSGRLGGIFTVAVMEPPPPLKRGAQ